MDLPDFGCGTMAVYGCVFQKCPENLGCKKFQCFLHHGSDRQRLKKDFVARTYSPFTYPVRQSL
jgi:hypothetical protein